MIRPLFPNINVNRDQGDTVRKTSIDDLLLPEDVKGDVDFNWTGNITRRRQEFFGMKMEGDYNPNGNPIRESVDLFGECKITHNYDPKTGEYIGSVMEV